MRCWFWLDKNGFDSYVNGRAPVNVIGGGRFAFVGEFIVCETIELFPKEVLQYYAIQLGTTSKSIYSMRESIRVNGDFMDAILDRCFADDPERLRDFSWETGLDGIDAFARDVLGIDSTGNAPLSGESDE